MPRPIRRPRMPAAPNVEPYRILSTTGKDHAPIPKRHSMPVRSHLDPAKPQAPLHQVRQICVLRFFRTKTTQIQHNLCHRDAGPGGRFCDVSLCRNDRGTPFKILTRPLNASAPPQLLIVRKLIVSYQFASFQILRIQIDTVSIAVSVVAGVLGPRPQLRADSRRDRPKPISVQLEFAGE